MIGIVIAVTGASGLIGSALCRHLEERGTQVLRCVRRTTKDAGEIQWTPEAEYAIAPNSVSRLESCDAIVHLAGENVAGGLWTKERKRRIRESRVSGTAALCRSLARLSQPPRVLISASAVGFYGDRGQEALTEASGAGDGFLAQLCQEWEQAADPARAAGIRVVHPRFGIVLDRRGGALAKMLPPFRFGLGAVLGGGTQMLPWITLQDTVNALLYLLDQENTEGAYNLVAPNPVSQSEFAHTLARTLHRPLLLRMPAFALRMLAGEMADEALLSSENVIPARLQAAGFQFGEPQLESALRGVLD